LIPLNFMIALPLHLPRQFLMNPPNLLSRYRLIYDKIDKESIDSPMDLGAKIRMLIWSLCLRGASSETDQSFWLVFLMKGARLKKYKTSFHLDRPAWGF
jgi:hypothetical protein